MCGLSYRCQRVSLSNVLPAWTLDSLLCLCYGRELDWPYTYVCQHQDEVIGGRTIKSRCVKEIAQYPNPVQDLNGCLMTCDGLGTLWPKPTGNVVLSELLFETIPQNIDLKLDMEEESEKVKAMFEELKDVFKIYMYQTHPEYDGSGKNPYPDNDGIEDKLDITLKIKTGESSLKMSTDESFSLVLDQIEDTNDFQVVVEAENYFGARHAVETISQLITYNEVRDVIQIYTHAKITDAPKYPHRGLMIDTSRNFVALPILKRLVDGLSYNKMNVLHWHVTDTHSFPIVLNNLEGLAKYGSYSPRKTYQSDEVKDLIEYGRVRGVKIIPEFDTPAHVGNGWQFFEKDSLEKLVLCLNSEPWAEYCVEPPCGQFNVINDHLYDILEIVYREFIQLFDSDMFHMGGDEVIGQHNLAHRSQQNY